MFNPPKKEHFTQARSWAGLGLLGIALSFSACSSPTSQSGAACSAEPSELKSETSEYYAAPLVRSGQTTQQVADPLLSKQWSLSEFGVLEAWSAVQAKDTVVVAVVDTGVNTTHPDLSANMLPGCDLYDNDSDVNSGPPLTKLSAHGTHVVSIIGAVGENGIGVAGIAYPNVKVVPVKVFDDAGETSDPAMLAAGIRWAAGLDVEGFALNKNPADIINVSLGVEDESEALRSAVSAALGAGILVVAAAGNDGLQSGLNAPASFQDVIAVGSVNRQLSRSLGSNYAKEGRTVDFVAPGGDTVGSCPEQTILGAVPEGTALPKLNRISEVGYGCLSGTSMAAAFVSGVAALVLSNEPNLTQTQLHNRLRESTFHENAWSEAEYGAGVLCADRALGQDTLCGKN